MADIHDRGRALAIRLLSPRSFGGKGLELTLQSNSFGEYDPETGGSPVGVTSVDGSGLRTSYDNRDIDGTYILQGDVKIIISPVALSGADMPQPASPDHILFDGSDYTVISVQPWSYAGTVCGYEVQARG